MKQLILICIIGMASFSSMAQRVVPSKVPLSFRWAEAEASPQDLVHLYVKGDHARIQSWVGAQGGIFKYTFRAYASIALPLHAVAGLDTCDFVDYIHFEYGKGQPLLSKSRIHTGVNKVHAGTAGLPNTYKGDGVIMGVIDAGIELQHPDFRYDNGATRIIELWDQTMSYDAQRTPSYGYGQVWDSIEINDSICPHSDQAAWYGHGTNTAGIAAGDGSTNSGYTGIAPETELIVVSSDFTALGWTNTVADAVDYIFSRAEALGKPCVINASVGTYLGSHDARDPAAVAIDDDLTASSGRILVCAAGNSGDQPPYHLGYDAGPDTNFTWFKPQSGATPGNGSIGFELYGDVGDFEHVQFAFGADKTSPGYAFRGSTAFDSVLNRIQVIYYDTIYSHSGEYLASVLTYADSNNGTYNLQVLIDQIDSVQYNYRLRITGQGRFDLWAANWLGYKDMVYEDLPSSAVFPDIDHYKLPDQKQSIVSSWACSDKVITVGNMTNRVSYVDVDGNQVVLSGQTEGDLAANSSSGPSRLGNVKPDVTAPGDNTLTAGAFFQLENLLNNPSQRNRVGVGGMHHRAGGTSSASPVVAGIGALFLEKCPGSDWSDFKSAITQHAFDEDNFTGTLPNDRWGHGKVNAVKALRASTPRPNLIYPTTEFCEGEALELSLAQSFPSVLWNTGDTGSSTMATVTDVYFAQVIDEKGCVGYSDSVSIFRRPGPDVPLISSNKDVPLCEQEHITLSVDESFGGYTWSNGANTQSIEVNEAGTYVVTVHNQYDCTEPSLPFEVSYHPGMPDPLLSLQADDRLYLDVDTSAVEAVRWYFNDALQTINHAYTFKVENLGVYRADYLDSNECVHRSNSVNVFALRSPSLDPYSLDVYPNPFKDRIWITSPQAQSHWTVRNALGQLVGAGRMNGVSGSIETTTWPSGVYLLEVKGMNADVQVIKLIK